MKTIRFFALSLLSVALLCVCACTSSEKKKEAATQDKTELENLVGFWWASLPNAMNNEMTRQAFADSVKYAMQKGINDTLPILSDIKLVYKSCEVYKRTFETFESAHDKNAGRYLVTFYYSKDRIVGDVGTYFNVVTILDPDKVASLVEDSMYHVQGTFVDFANNSKETGLVFPNGYCYTHYPKLGKDGFGNPSLNLGTLVLDNATIKP